MMGDARAHRLGAWPTKGIDMLKLKESDKRLTNRVLDMADVRRWRRDYGMGKVTAREIMEECGLSMNSVRRMLSGETYRDVERVTTEAVTQEKLRHSELLMLALNGMWEEIAKRGPTDDELMVLFADMRLNPEGWDRIKEIQARMRLASEVGKSPDEMLAELVKKDEPKMPDPGYED